MVLNIIGLVLSSITAVISFYNFFRALEIRFNKNDMPDIDGEVISCLRKEYRPDGITKEYTYDLTICSSDGKIHHICTPSRKTALYLCKKNNISITVPSLSAEDDTDFALIGTLSSMMDKSDSKKEVSDEGSFSEILVWFIVGMIFLAISIFWVFAFFTESGSFSRLLLRLIYGE